MAARGRKTSRSQPARRPGAPRPDGARIPAKRFGGPRPSRPRTESADAAGGERDAASGSKPFKAGAPPRTGTSRGDPRNRPARSVGRGAGQTAPEGTSSRTNANANASTNPNAEGERLQKVLARLGVGSRREAEEWIRAGRITVNGEPVVLGRRVTRSDHLRLDGRLIHRHEIAAGQAFICHRSPGENLRTPDEASEHRALIERLPARAGNRFISVSQMPHMDGGLEIVTSDGELAVRLQRTIQKLPSEFSVRIKGELQEPQINAILEGMLDRGERLQVESCEASGGEAANRWYTLIARGGSGKDVRQLFERQGALVSRILRTRVGTLELDRLLSRGQFRALTQSEIDSLTTVPTDAESGDDSAGD